MAKVVTWSEVKKRADAGAFGDVSNDYGLTGPLQSIEFKDHLVIIKLKWTAMAVNVNEKRTDWQLTKTQTFCMGLNDRAWEEEDSSIWFSVPGLGEVVTIYAKTASQLDPTIVRGHPQYRGPATAA